VRARYLVDTSALLRLHRPDVARVVAPLLQQGAVAVCTPILLEVLHAARAKEHARVLEDYEASTTVLPISAAISERAVEVHSALAARGQHRTTGTVDLLIAATAEVHALTLLHYDRDFDAIAAVTEQPADWVVPAGSVD
jgi:hypothetical protein